MVLSSGRARFVALLALVVLIAAAVPALAGGFDAKNADKVDGKHATSSTTTASKRRNKLVAAGKTGYLPNNIIKMAPNSAKLGGQTLAQVIVSATDVYTAGAGLGLESDQFSLLPAFQLPQGCAAGEVPAAGAGAWSCLTLPEGTAYTAGAGLSLTGGGEFSIVFAGSGSASTAARSDHHHNATYLGLTAKASDADRIDGLDSSQLVSNGCPVGYTSDGSLCWESQDAFGFTLAGAANRCRAQGGRLPLLSEFMALKASGIALSNSVSLDWTGNTAGDNNSIYINSEASAEDMDGVRANSTSSWARCVRPRVNSLGSS
jgi:hypothetical protein